MKTFIEHIAEDIIRRFGNNLADVAVVFPNKRASLFLNEALVNSCERPVLAPKYYTISDLFAEISGNSIADSIRLVCMLHTIFQQVTKSDETLDRFFPWGEIIISDFDDIDKHQLDAKKIFTNVRDFHELDDISFLTDEQKETLRHFFPDYEGNNTRLKEKFLKLWSKLADIYTEFHKVMTSTGCMYEGALYRNAIEKLSGNVMADKQIKHVIFIGFNHLLPVERELFKRLKAETDTLFYWDYDKFYIDSHEAGEEIRKGLVFFPNALDESDEIYNNFCRQKDITVLSSATDNLQARYVHDWLKQGNRCADGRRSVIVLADESLLPTVIHSLPDDVEKVNITIGYSLSFTNIPQLILRLTASSGYKKLATATERLSFLADAIHDEAKKNDDTIAALTSAEKALRQESLFRTFTLINRLLQLTSEGVLNVSETTMQKLLMQLLNSTSVPFHGEPLEGVQIMGVLETRNLDFDNILMLSCNEGTMPKASESTSFIPYFLRKAYELTTIDNKVNIFAYYFYRLLQRCSNATLLWNKSTEGIKRGEMSRFILQLMVESPHNIHRMALNTGQSVSKSAITNVDKTPEIMEALRKRFARILSPSAINTYLRCQKKFYYQYVLQLEEYEDEEEIDQDNRTFGNIFHAAVHELYKQFGNREISATALENINDRANIRKVVIQAYIKELTKSGNRLNEELRSQEVKESLQPHNLTTSQPHNLTREVEELRSSSNQSPVTSNPISPLPLGEVGDVLSPYHFDGLQSIKIDVLVHYICQLITIDRRMAPFSILALEEKYSTDIDLKVIRSGDKVVRSDSPQNLKLSIGGIIDRIDKKGDCIRVVDYKTGGSKFSVKLNNVEDIFNPANINNHSDYFLQTFLYSCIVDDQKSKEEYYGGEENLKTFPSLLFIQHSAADDYNPILQFHGEKDLKPISEYKAEFMQRLHSLVNEIFNENNPFVARANSENADEHICDYCPFKNICQNIG